MSDFDPIRAQRELLTGLRDIHKLLLTRSTNAQGKLAEAEAEANGLMKLERFAREQIDVAQAKLRKLEEVAASPPQRHQGDET